MTKAMNSGDNFDSDPTPEGAPGGLAKPPDKKPASKKKAATAKRNFRHVEHTETFTHQPTPSSELPLPEPWIEMMVSGVLESIHGVRDARQFARWMTQEVFHAVEARSKSVQLRHQTLKKPIARPVFALGNVVINHPRDGVVEAAAVVHGPTRVRAVAIRMEGLDRRWLTTSFRML
jgi:hypothetical protein